MTGELMKFPDVRTCLESEAVCRDLEDYRKLLIKWQKVQNLVSRETVGDIWKRHFEDSLQILSYLPCGSSNIIDIGSGGGFPAIPMAIASRNHSLKFTLVEANKRKAAFLREVSRQLQLNLRVYGVRIEQLDPSGLGDFDVITSRATAPLDRLLGMVAPLWSKKTVAIFHKGRDFGAELAESRANWSFDVVKRSSEVDMSGVVLQIRHLERRCS